MAEQLEQQLNTKPSVTIKTPMTHEDTITSPTPRASYTISMIRQMLEEHSSLSLEENVSRLEKNQASVCNAVDELRKDVISVRGAWFGKPGQRLLLHVCEYANSKWFVAMECEQVRNRRINVLILYAYLLLFSLYPCSPFYLWQRPWHGQHVRWSTALQQQLGEVRTFRILILIFAAVGFLTKLLLCLAVC